MTTNYMKLRYPIHTKRGDLLWRSAAIGAARTLRSVLDRVLGELESTAWIPAELAALLEEVEQNYAQVSSSVVLAIESAIKAAEARQAEELEKREAFAKEKGIALEDITNDSSGDACIRDDY